MTNRPFSNNKIISYTDYISDKRGIINKSNHLKESKQNIQKRYANYSNLIQYKNRKYTHCPPLMPCLASPLTIIQGNSSYICELSKKESYVCKDVKAVLYPYGHYLCRLDTCNTFIQSETNTLLNDSTNLNGSGNDFGSGSGSGNDLGTGTGSNDPTISKNKYNNCQNNNCQNNNCQNNNCQNNNCQNNNCQNNNCQNDGFHHCEGFYHCDEAHRSDCRDYLNTYLNLHQLQYQYQRQLQHQRRHQLRDLKLTK
jgi:hypothetical protein